MSQLKSFAYVCADPGIPLPGAKGASIHVASFCHALESLGMTGEVHTLRPEGEKLGGCHVRRIPLPPRLGRSSPASRETRLFLGNVGSGLALDGSYDFVYERYSLWHVEGLARARQRGIPFVLEVNSPLPDEASRFRGLVQEELARGVARLLMREADGVVCVSDAVAEWVARLREDDRGVWVVPNGVDPDTFSPGPAQECDALPGNVPVIAFSGGFRPWHATDDLLRAFRILLDDWADDARLLCVGDGPRRESFEEQARALGIADRIHVTGLVDHRQVPLWLRHAQIAVAPYPAVEPFYFSPLKMFEYLSVGLPVVAANVGGLHEIVPHQERGLLYTPGNPQELADAMAHLLRNPAKALEMGRAGRQWVLDHATWSRRVESILEKIDGR